MTAIFTASAAPAADRHATCRRYLMCPPTYFEVAYAINPWMDPGRPAGRGRALDQWESLRRAYARLGHQVDLVEPLPRQPDMVFAANGALVLDGKVFGSRFRDEQRAAEAPTYMRWFGAAGFHDVREPEHVCEGEGDLLAVDGLILAGMGFRTDPAAHREAQEYFGRPVISLQLADPRYYHLDTALAVLDDENVAYYPAAFSPGSRQVLRRLFPDATIATDADAAAFGLNLVSDGHNVVLPIHATGLARTLRERGYEPVPVDVSELLKAGGSVKCCTLEIRG
ncbi:MAG: dimethylargininase [Streptosporangiaceae bacterium]